MTTDQEARLTSYMRALEVLRKYETEVAEVPGLPELVTQLKTQLDAIFAILTPEDVDAVLERYKEDMAFLMRVGK